MLPYFSLWIGRLPGSLSGNRNLHDFDTHKELKSRAQGAVMKFDKLKQRWLAESIERRRRAEEMKSSLIRRGHPVFKKFKIGKVILFGSVLDGRSTTSSDLDVLVMPLKKDDYWIFKHEIEEAVGHPVDLYTQDDDPLFVSKIIARGVVVYGI